jgi:TonB family protein
VAAAAAPVVVPPQRLDSSDVPYPPDGSGDATVVLTLVVDANGEVTDATVRDGRPPFDAAAVQAVRRWRFAPATRDEVPIVARITATVAFHAPAPAPAATAPAVVPPASTLVPPPPDETPTLDVSVKGQREEPSTLHLPRTEARLVPGTFGDPFKIVEALPGMAPWLSGLPYYYVRGSPPESVGYFVDGIRVPLLFHVGPGPSTLAPALVDSVDVFPAAYPARYGRFAGAVITGETLPPVTDHAHGEFSARVYDASAFAETPFDGGKGNLMAASRYSYTGPLISVVVPHYSLDYWDYQLRASHTVGDAGTLTLFAFGAHDELHYYGQPTFNIEYHRVDLRFDHPLKGGAVRVAFTFNYDDTLTATQTNGGAGPDAAQKGPGGRLRTEIDERLSDSARIRAGADIGTTRYTVDQYPAIDGFLGAQGPHTDVEGGVYADVVWRPTRTLEIVPGFRFDGYETRQSAAWAPQPRLATRLRITPALTWISAMGTAHQEPTEQVFVPAKIPNLVDQGSQTSYQFSEGLEARLPSSMRARITGFYTYLISEHILGTGASETGQSGGLEVFVHRDFSRRLGGMISYTLSRTVGTAGGVTQRVGWDRTHVVSIVASYDLGRSWRVGARMFVESGRPYPPVCVRSCGTSAPGPMAVFYTPQADLPAFWRVDARLEKRWSFPGGQWITGALECFNVSDNAEPVGAELAPDGRTIAVRDQSAIILPTVAVEGGF